MTRIMVALSAYEAGIDDTAGMIRIIIRGELRARGGYGQVTNTVPVPTQ